MSQPPPLFPRLAPRRVIDTHAHLELCDGRPEDVVAAAAEAGVSRILTVGREQAVALAEGFPGVWAIVGVHPHEAGEVADAGAVVRDLLGHPRAVAVGECGLDFYRDYAPRDDQRRVFAAQIELANEVGLPLVIHTRAADDETFAMLEAAGCRSSCTASARSIGSTTRSSAATSCSFAGNVAYPKAEDLREAAAPRARRPHPGRDRQRRTWRRRRIAAAPTSRPTSCAPSTCWPPSAASTAGARGADRRQRDRVFGL